MKKLSVMFCLVLSMGVLTACDDAEETIQNIDEQEELAEGRFLSDCAGFGVDRVAGISKRDQIEFLSNQTEIKTTYYSSSDCAESSVIGEKEYDGEFTVEQSKSEDGVDQGVMQFELEEARITPSNETLVTALNAINYCGVDSYAVDETAELTNQSDLLTCPLEELPAELTKSQGRARMTDAKRIQSIKEGLEAKALENPLDPA
jgi:hypothetical protein